MSASPKPNVQCPTPNNTKTFTPTCRFVSFQGLKNPVNPVDPVRKERTEMPGSLRQAQGRRTGSGSGSGSDSGSGFLLRQGYGGQAGSGFIPRTPEGIFPKGGQVIVGIGVKSQGESGNSGKWKIIQRHGSKNPVNPV